MCRLELSSTFAKVILISLIALAGLFQIAQSQATQLSITVAEVTAMPGQQQIQIPVYFDNYQDTIAGLEIWFHLDRPDICEFDVDSVLMDDTTYWQCTNGTPPACLDSVQVTGSAPYDFVHVNSQYVLTGGISLTGGLVENWQTVITRSLGGLGHDLKVVGIVQLPESSLNRQSIAPQTGGLLFNLVVNCYAVPDTLFNRTAIVSVSNSLGNFSFSDLHGNSIGITCDGAEPNPICYLDTLKTDLNSGSITLLHVGLPGDVDGSGSYTVEDMVLLTGFAATGSPALPAPQNGDVNGDCCINLLDVQLLNGGGPYVPTPCSEPVWCCCLGTRGNVDYDIANELDDIDIADLTFMVSFMFSAGTAPPCLLEADINGSEDGKIDISDLTDLVQYMFRSGAAPGGCE